MSYKKKYSKGEMLFPEGALCEQIGLLSEGELVISSVSYKGTEILYKTIQKGEYFGNNLIFSSTPYYRGNVTAKEDSEVSYFTKEEFLTLLRKDERLLEEYLISSSENTRLLNQSIKILSLPTAEEKLFYLLSVSGNEISSPSITDLSKKLFLSREATSRMVHKLLKDKIILMDGNTLRKA